MQLHPNFRPLDERWRRVRDSYRATGCELVHYSEEALRNEARATPGLRSPLEYGLHAIESTEGGWVRIAMQPERRMHVSDLEKADRALLRAREENHLTTGDVVKNFFKQPEWVLLSLFVPPYGLGVLLCVVVSHNTQKAAARKQAELLKGLHDTPVSSS